MKFTLPLIALLTGIPLVAAPIAAHAGTDSPELAHPAVIVGAPAELAHWGELIGQWSTTEESLKSDGSGWEPSKGADWNFHWAFDGWGIRDDYFSPPLATQLDDESTRQRGINLRIYNPIEKKWIMTWLTTKSSKPATFTATSDESKIVMLSDVANPQGFHGRVTFFDMTATAFEWKLEWSQDKESWREVYRIHATRKSP